MRSDLHACSGTSSQIEVLLLMYGQNQVEGSRRPLPCGSWTEQAWTQFQSIVQVPAGGGQKFSPSQISGFILGKMRETAGVVGLPWNLAETCMC